MYDESESEPLTEFDTPNDTKFYASDTTADYDGIFRLDGTATHKQHYSRLARMNTGVFNGKWADESVRRRQDNLALCDSICSALDLTPYQKRVTRQTFDDLGLSELSSPNGIDAALVAIVTAAIVVRRDGRMYHPNRGPETNDPLFVDLVADLGYRHGTVVSCYGKVLNRVSL